MLCLHVDLLCLLDLSDCGASCCFCVQVNVSENKDDGVGEDFDEGLAEKVGFTVEESQKRADVGVNSSWLLFGEFLEENSDVFYAYCLCSAVSVEYLASHFTNDVVDDVWSLPCDN